MTRFTAIINVDGSVTEVPFTAEEEAARDIAEAEYVAAEPARKWAMIRAQRDALLASSDWMANSDVTMSDAWKAYRQVLRNLPASQSNPDDIVFPEEPS